MSQQSTSGMASETITQNSLGRVALSERNGGCSIKRQSRWIGLLAANDMSTRQRAS